MRLLEARTLVTVSSSEGVAPGGRVAWKSALLVAKSGGKEVSHIEKISDLHLTRVSLVPHLLVL